MIIPFGWWHQEHPIKNIVNPNKWCFDDMDCQPHLLPEDEGISVEWDEDVLRVRYGADGAPKNAGPRPFSPPRPAQWPGAGCLFRHSLPLSPLRPLLHPYPRRVPVKNRW